MKKMKEKNMLDDEIQILGQDWKKSTTRFSRRTRQLLWLLLIAVCVLVAAIFVLAPKNNADEPSSVFLEIPTEEQSAGTDFRGYIETSEETVNDVPLRIYIPHNATPELRLDLPEESDSTVIFVTPAADVGGNNYGIVGDFVLAGKQLATGVSKKGFCAIINQVMTIGTGTETALLQKSIHENGYFFRQYPLVKNSVAVENKPKGKSIRRALAIRDGQVIMVESLASESFHDFAQALVDAGISEAIYLRGSASVFGWYRDEKGELTTFGNGQETHLEGVNYLVWLSEPRFFQD
jgi:hypothetical protein